MGEHACRQGFPYGGADIKRYSEEKLTTITGEITEALEAAHLGHEPWALPAVLFSAAFPGGFAALINQDFVHDKINFMEWVNLNPDSADSYVAKTHARADRAGSSRIFPRIRPHSGRNPPL